MIRKIIEDDDQALFYRLPYDDLAEPEQAAYTSIDRHLRDHNRFPAVETLRERGHQLPDAPEPLSYYRDQFFNSLRLRRGSEFVLSMQEAINSGDGYQVDSLIAEMQRVGDAPELSTVPLSNHYAGFIDRLNPSRARSNRVAIGLPALDQSIGGVKRGDMIVTAGRPASGKTYVQLQCALTLAEMGERVVYISKEMSQEQIDDRLFFMLMDIDPGVNSSRFSTDTTIATARDRRQFIPPAILDNLLFPEHRQIRSTSDVRALVRTERPTILMIDGTYFLDPTGLRKNADQRERYERIIRDTKQLCDDETVTTHLTWQMNRKKEYGGTEGFYGTDAISQDASVAVYLKSVAGEPNMRECVIAKNRHGHMGFSLGITYGFRPTRIGDMCVLPDATERRSRRARRQAGAGLDGYVSTVTGTGSRRRHADSDAGIDE